MSAPDHPKCKDTHTETLLHGVVVDEICAFSGLLSHEYNNVTMRFYLLKGFSFIDKGVDIIHDGNQMDNGVIAVHLTNNHLDIISILHNGDREQRRFTLCVAERMPHTIFAYG
jgi:hypothetical protein